MQLRLFSEERRFLGQSKARAVHGAVQNPVRLPPPSPIRIGPAPTRPYIPVVVVGAGPVGLSLAIDLAQRGQPVVLLDDADRIGEGSRAICFSKRSLEYWDRLGVGQRMVDKGVVWSVGRIFHGASLLYQFNLLPEQGHRRPAFINLQQFHAEAYLVDRVCEFAAIDLRWRNKVTGLEQRNDHVVLTVETPDGPYRMRATMSWPATGRNPAAANGRRGFRRQVFEDQFLIADVRMTAEFPTERWFWFDPPFHAGRSALLHKQPDDIWRIDLQLSPDAIPAVEKLPENVQPRIARMLGHDKFEFEWISLYKFQCRRMDKFIHDRVIFAGDAAHQVSPFGARGRQFRPGGRRESGVEARSGAAAVSPEPCWRAITSSAARLPTRTSGSRPARPISWRPSRARRRGCAGRCCRSPGTPNSASA